MTGKNHRDIRSILTNNIFLEVSGFATTLIFHDKIELPEFATFPLLRTEDGTRRVIEFSRLHANIAIDYGVGNILGSVGWRASRDWATKLDISMEELEVINTKSIKILKEIQEDMETIQSPMIVVGTVGPRADAYSAAKHHMTVTEAEAYHREQISTYYNAGAEMICAYTMNYIEEGLGVVNAAKSFDMPVAISFTIEMNGHLPSGQTLQEAIEEIDRWTDSYPLYYMINCVHPMHMLEVLKQVNLEPDSWVYRIRGIRANASKKSHAELDESTTLDDGNPEEYGQYCDQLRKLFPQINVLGGCCGTDHRHIQQICEQCNFQRK